MRALVVEDELKMAALLRRGLTEEGYAADIARTGDDALWMARAAPYDVIVLDVMLPGRDGFAVCRELREAGVGRRSSCSRRATRSRTASTGSTRAPTTT